MKTAISLIICACFLAACSSSSGPSTPSDTGLDVPPDATMDTGPDTSALPDTARPDVFDASDVPEPQDTTGPDPDVADAASPTDTADPGPDVPDVPPGPRTMVHRTAFGETDPANLLLDPMFTIRQMSGLGSWEVTTLDMFATTSPIFGAALFSDSPSGIALDTAYLLDAPEAKTHVAWIVLAQVPGGPGPFHLKVWVSIQDEEASASLEGVKIGVLDSVYSKAIEVSEDPGKARVLAGRTWHLFDGVIDTDLALGGYVAFQFTPSANTWLLQAPEFVPVALEKPVGPATPPLRPGVVRPMTPAEWRAVVRYASRPRISVPAFHPIVQEGDDR